jgi:hypothetical protein
MAVTVGHMLGVGPDGRVTFERWMGMVDTRIRKLAWGITARDLPDCSYRDWYDSGMSPTEAADEALEDAGFDEHDY